MWKILKAELHYNRTAIIVFLAILTVNFIAAMTNALVLTLEFQGGRLLFSPLAVFGDFDDSLYPFLVNSGIAFAATATIIGMSADKQKLERVYHLRPSKLRRFSLSRLLLIHILHFAVVGLGVILLFAKYSPAAGSAIWSIFSLGFLTLSGLISMYVLHDLGFYEKRALKWIGYGAVALLVMMLNAILILGDAAKIWQAFTSFVRSPAGALFFTAGWFAMIAFSRKVYERRNSFLA